MHLPHPTCHWQDVTLRLIAERLLPAEHPPTFVQGELVDQPVPHLPPPTGQFHVCCSQVNAGAAALLSEVAERTGLAVQVCDDEARLDECDCMLVYLNSATWTSGEASHEVRGEAMRAHCWWSAERGCGRRQHGYLPHATPQHTSEVRIG